VKAAIRRETVANGKLAVDRTSCRCWIAAQAAIPAQLKRIPACAETRA